MRKIFFLMAFCVCAIKSEDSFQKLGDIFRLAPLIPLAISIGIEDYEGAMQLALGTAASQVSVEVIKLGFHTAHTQGASVAFAKRPCCDEYRGMPSGHSAGAFSAASYVYYRYGFRQSLPLIGIGVATAASRIHAKKHSFAQVLAGGAISWGFAWLFTSPYKPKNMVITPEVGEDSLGGDMVGIRIGLRF